MDGFAAIALMVLAPLAALAVLMGVFFILGRWTRSLRRQGKLHYSARTASSSADFSGSSGV